MKVRRAGLSEAAQVALASGPRLQVLLLCEEQSWTATELSAELDIKRQTALYHLRELQRAGLVKETGRTPVSGGPVTSYGATHDGWADLVASINAFAGPDTGP